jgi:hypothetical protein
MSGVGRSNCRATNAEIVYLIDENGKLGEYSVSMELSEIIVNWRGRPTSLFEGDGRMSGAVGMCEPEIGGVNRFPSWSIFCFDRLCENSQPIDRNMKIKADSRTLEIGF